MVRALRKDLKECRPKSMALLPVLEELPGHESEDRRSQALGWFHGSTRKPALLITRGSLRRRYCHSNR
jgi:hypothetical protein